MQRSGLTHSRQLMWRRPVVRLQRECVILDQPFDEYEARKK